VRDLVFYPQVAEDLRNLPRRSLQVIVIDLLTQIKMGTERGRPLSFLDSTGDLSDCRKVYFDDRDGSPRFRIVIMEHGRAEVEIVEIVAVGRREDLHVYRAALKRLGRMG
jgi:hypothetical protein